MVLDMKNKDHISEIMKYGKAKGVLLAYQYNLPTFDEMYIIHNIEEWNEVKDKLPNKFTFRADTLLGDNDNIYLPRGESGPKERVEGYIEKVKNVDSDGVVLCFVSKYDFCDRYDTLGGFNILIEPQSRVVIEYVGKGFDGGEITRGVDVHETYVIPWDEILFVNSGNYHNYLIKTISNYGESRKSRIDFLVSVGENKDLIEKHIPNDYAPIAFWMFEELVNQIIEPLFIRIDELGQVCIPGNIQSDEQLMVYEIWKKERSKR